MVLFTTLSLLSSDSDSHTKPINSVLMVTFDVFALKDHLCSSDGSPPYADSGPRLSLPTMDSLHPVTAFMQKRMRHSFPKFSNRKYNSLLILSLLIKNCLYRSTNVVQFGMMNLTDFIVIVAGI